MLILRSLFFTVLLPGTVTVVMPYYILSGRHAAMDAMSILGQPRAWGGVSLIVVGAAVLLRCIWDFAVVGHGTLAPVDPPTQLVVRGLYRYVRNPMYVGVLGMLSGEALLFASLSLLEYAAGFFAAAHLFIVLYEEPTLRCQFGASYERFVQTVHRWLPGRPSDQI